MPPVFDLSLEIGNGAQVATTVFLPAQPQAPLPVMFLLPGGGLSRRYFDIQFQQGENYSQARWFTQRGYVVVAMDYFGAGDSTLQIDGVPPSRDEVEQAVASAVREIHERLLAGTLAGDFPAASDCILIGAGHSVGGHVIVGTQGTHDVFDGICLLGASMTKTRLQLKPGKHYPYRTSSGNEILAVTRDVDWIANDHWPDVPQWVIDEDRARDPLPPWRTRNVPMFAGVLVEAFASARQAANVRSPVQLIYGEQDVTAEPLDDVSVFRCAPSVSLVIVPGMGHSHNMANSREQAWMRLHLFAREVTAIREFD